MTKLHGGAIVDIGNVIIAYRFSGLNPRNYHLYPFTTIPEEPGAFAVLSILNRMFGGNITIVWKATDDAVGKNMRWLADHRFCERTGIPMSRVKRIGKERSEKALHVEQSSDTHYGTTVVIDDRLEVLDHFIRKVPHLFLFRRQLREIRPFAHTGQIRSVKSVWAWQEILDHLRA